MPGPEDYPIDGVDRFQTTHWSLVLEAGNRGSAKSNEALARLCGDYWVPLYVFVRRFGNSAHAAEDLTQEFFAQLLEKEYLQDADRSRGRFRSFLLGAVKHFLVNRRKAERAQKRGGRRSILSLDFAEAEAACRVEPWHADTPERLFARQWALVVLSRVMSRLEEEWSKGGKAEQFGRLRGLLTADKAQPAYRTVAEELGTSEAGVKMAVHRLRKRYRELLRDEIAQTVADPAEIEDELKGLFAALAEKSD
jgi:RNA polymerase sigma-70 factor (ECF subfamily)